MTGGIAKAVAALTALGPAAAAASPCGATKAPGAEVVERFEAIVLEHDWDAYEAALPRFAPGALTPILSQLRTLPVPFDTCEVVYEARLPPAVWRRAVVYYIGGEVAQLMQYDMMVLNGTLEVVNVNYETSFTALMERIR